MRKLYVILLLMVSVGILSAQTKHPANISLQEAASQVPVEAQDWYVAGMMVGVMFANGLMTGDKYTQAEKMKHLNIIAQGAKNMRIKGIFKAIYRFGLANPAILAEGVNWTSLSMYFFGFGVEDSRAYSDWPMIIIKGLLDDAGYWE